MYTSTEVSLQQTAFVLKNKAGFLNTSEKLNSQAIYKIATFIFNQPFQWCHLLAYFCTTYSPLD
jgi:hypothetical protein